MSKIAFLFPGQGAQYVGMGKDFYEAFPVCREVFEEASKASGLDIPALCFEENDKLNQTEYTQICMLAVEAAILKAVETQGIQPWGVWCCDRLRCDESGRCISGSQTERYLYAGSSSCRWSYDSSSRS